VVRRKKSLRVRLFPKETEVSVLFPLAEAHNALLDSFLLDANAGVAVGAIALEPLLADTGAVDYAIRQSDIAAQQRGRALAPERGAHGRQCAAAVGLRVHDRRRAQ
jgi:hypothetical protein